jgi:hypothetical protein
MSPALVMAIGLAALAGGLVYLIGRRPKDTPPPGERGRSRFGDSTSGCSTDAGGD